MITNKEGVFTPLRQGGVGKGAAFSEGKSKNINVADGLVKGGIPLSSVQQAAACCEYLESHARRIYGMVLESSFQSLPTVSKVDELLAWIKNNQPRLASQNNQPRLASP